MLMEVRRDPLTPAQRRRAMRGNVSQGTLPETRLRMFLEAEGWALHPSGYALSGPAARRSDRIIRPDAVLKEGMAVVQLQGCFWHGCPQHFTPVAVDPDGYWARKHASNKSRDRRKAAALRSWGYAVFTVWEHDVVPLNFRRLLRLSRALFRRTIDAERSAGD